MINNGEITKVLANAAGSTNTIDISAKSNLININWELIKISGTDDWLTIAKSGAGNTRIVPTANSQNPSTTADRSVTYKLRGKLKLGSIDSTTIIVTQRKKEESVEHTYSTVYRLEQVNAPTVAYNATYADIKYRVYWTEYVDGSPSGNEQGPSSTITISNYNIGSNNSGTIDNIYCNNGNNSGYANLSWNVNREDAPVVHNYTTAYRLEQVNIPTVEHDATYANIEYRVYWTEYDYNTPIGVELGPSRTVTIANYNIGSSNSGTISDITCTNGDYPGVADLSWEVNRESEPVEPTYTYTMSPRGTINRVEFAVNGDTQTKTFTVTVSPNGTPDYGNLNITANSASSWLDASLSDNILTMTADNNYDDNSSTNERQGYVIVVYGDTGESCTIPVYQPGHEALGGNSGGGEIDYVDVANNITNTDLYGVNEHNQVVRGGEFSVVAKNGYYFADEISVTGGEATLDGEFDMENRRLSYVINVSNSHSVDTVRLSGSVIAIQTTPASYTVSGSVSNATISPTTVTSGGSITITPDSGYKFSTKNDVSIVSGSATDKTLNSSGEIVISGITSNITLSGYATRISYSLTLTDSTVNISNSATTMNLSQYVASNTPAGTPLKYTLSEGDTSVFDLNDNILTVLSNATTSQRSCKIIISQDVTSGDSEELIITQGAGEAPVTQDEYEIVLAKNPLDGAESTTIQIKKNGSVITPNWDNLSIDVDSEGYATAILSGSDSTLRTITVGRGLGGIAPVSSSFYIGYYVNGEVVADANLEVSWE